MTKLSISAILAEIREGNVAQQKAMADLTSALVKFQTSAVSAQAPAKQTVAKSETIPEMLKAEGIEYSEHTVYRVKDWSKLVSIFKVNNPQFIDKLTRK